MKNIKRIIALLLCLSMTMNIAISTVVAVETSPSEGLAFSLGPSKANYYVSGIGTCTDTEIVIPSTYKGLPVVSIVDGAFKDCASITSVIIPNSVESIGAEAFKNCSSLTSIEIPNSVKSIGDEAFSHCSSLTSIFIPASVTSIGGSVLTYCESLGSIVVDKSNTVYHSSGNCLINTAKKDLMAGCHNSVIPSDGSVDCINPHAFEGHTSLTSITVPGSVLSIYESAFAYCTSLTSVTIENGLLWYISNEAFSGCDVLQYNVYDNGKYLGNADNLYFALVEPVSNDITQINIHNDTKIVGADAFAGCNSIKSVLFPDNVENINRLDLSSESLASVYIMNPECDVQISTFDGPVTIYSHSGSWVENNYSHLAELGLRFVTLESVSDGLAFTLNEDGASYSVASIGTCKDTEVVIPAVYNGKPVTRIADHAFEGCTSLISITIPDSVTSIDNLAFYSCTNLQSVSIPDSVTSIGSSAFANCPSLTSITLPSNLTKISGAAFATCNGLTSVIIPNSVTSIVHGAFNQCYNIKDVYYTGTEAEWNAIDIVSNKNEYLLNANRYYYSETLPTVEGDFWHYVDDVPTVWGPVVSGSIGLEFTLNADNQSYSVSQGTCTDDHIVIPATYEGLPVTIISASAFVGSSLISITIPNSITTIEEMAFMWTSNFTDVYYIGTQEEWDALNKNDDANGELFEQVTIHFIGDSSTTHTSQGLKFSLNADEVSYSVTGIGTCTDTDVVIPAVYNGKPVTRIGSMAFMNGSSFTSMTIPDSVTSIGDWAFRYCTSLTSITIPDSVTSIGDQAFSECTGLTSVTMGNGITSIGDSVFYSCENLTSITIPDGVTSIGERAFSCCTNLTSVIIPDSVTSIGNYAFPSCTSLTSITIPDGITSIGEGVFSGCTNLTSITIPDSVTSIGDKAFDNCTGLTSITIPDGVTSIGERAFASCSGLTSVTIGTGVKSIGGYAFYDCKNITSITIPDGVTSIGEWAFCCCTGLTSVTIPDSVTSIGSSAFATCTALTSVTIPDSLTSIDEQVFYNCTGLTSIIIPNSITSIGEWAFINCINLNDVYFTGTEAEWNSIPVGSGNEPLTNATIYYYSETQPTVEGDFWHYVDDVPTVWESIGSGSLGLEFTLNADNQSYSVTGIGTCTDTNIVIPSTYESLPVTGIGDKAFMDCESLISVTIPDSVTSIGSQSFYSCRSLISVTIPDSITSIGKRAFYRCALTSITIPVSVTSIGLQAFGYCENLESIIVDENNPVYHSSDNCLIETESKTLIQGCKTSVIPTDGSVTIIGQYAFHTCKFTSITIPDTILNIENNAFFNCNKLTSITIPASVTSIGVQAFNGCSVLVSIEVDENNPVYHSSNNCLIETESKTLMQGCSTSVIPADGSVTRIAAYAFQAINGLESIIIPETISSIEQNTFYLCYSLTSITIPNSVTSIDIRAFMSCNKLTDVYFNGTEAEWSEIAIASDNDSLLNATIHFVNDGASVEITINNVGSEVSGAVITAPEGGWVIGNNTFTITCDKVCYAVVSYDNGDTYTRIVATATGEAYSFTAEITDERTIIAVVVAGDTNGDGAITNADSTRLSAAYAGKVDIDALQSIAADVNGDGEITNADITKLRAAYAEKTQLTW